jgi:formylglycine-generating enzyme
VTVGDPGNAPDTMVMATDATSGYGSVGYTYNIGKYDVTTAQYCQFLNAVAKLDTYSLYKSNMAISASGEPDNFGCGISQSGNPGEYSYSVTKEHENFPVNHVTLGDMARFCNWLQNGQPIGAQGPDTTETGAYTLNGMTVTSSLAGMRNAWADYFLPSENEWYKAAYYKGGSTNAGYWRYPTKSDTVPSNVLSSTGTNNANFYNGDFTDPTNYLTPVGYFAGSPGPYGTYDMGGNVWQWPEGERTSEFNYIGQRGGSFNHPSSYLLSSFRTATDPWNYAWTDVGFRVASIPEPSTLALLGMGAFGLLACAWQRSRKAV